jgi:DNA repair protein RadC
MAHKKAIRDRSAEDRPREKLFMLGVEQLSTPELVGILLQSGNREKSAIALGMELLELAKQNFQELGRLTPQEIAGLKGIGNAKAALICAAFELGRRRHASLPLDKNRSPEVLMLHVIYK